MAGLLEFLMPRQSQDPWSGMRQTGPMGGGMGDGFLSQLLAPEVALPMAAQLLGNQGNAANFGNAFGAAGQAIGEQKKLKAQTRERNQTLEYLRKNRPDLADMVDAGMPVSEAWGALTAQTPKGTDDMRELEQVNRERRAAGLPAYRLDEYMIKMKEAGRNQVNIDTGVKLPPGYRWLDKDNQDAGVEPIPGGPATQMPSELAARIGLAQDAIQRLDGVEQAAASGQLTGPIDWAKGQLGRGEQGQLGRELAAGAEALTRMLTGAGMNMAEAQREASLYLPQLQDDAPTLANKVSQLKRRLQSTIEMAGRGRGVTAPPLQSDGGGWQDLGGGVRIRRKQ